LKLQSAELSADEVFTALGSVDEPAAAGSAAALTGAFAAAIVCKAARAASRPASAAQAMSLQERLVRLARDDAEVLAAARSALQSRDAAASGERRDFALGQALRNASVVPAGIAETCADVAQLAANEHESVEADFAPDVAAAAILAAGAAQAAASLVAVNLLAHDNEGDVLSARQAAATAAEVVAQLTGL
jgi:formiminotetrahydrofolate cyclodeaminase